MSFDQQQERFLKIYRYFAKTTDCVISTTYFNNRLDYFNSFYNVECFNHFCSKWPTLYSTEVFLKFTVQQYLTDKVVHGVLYQSKSMIQVALIFYMALNKFLTEAFEAQRRKHGKYMGCMLSGEHLVLCFQFSDLF